MANDQEIRLNTHHRTNDGSDHDFIGQDVSKTASPTFLDTTVRDLDFSTGGGLSFAGIYAKDNAVTTTLNSAAHTQVTVFTTNTVFNGGLTPDHTNDHITVGAGGTGVYMATLYATVANQAAQSHVVHLEMFKNNGNIEFDNVHVHRTLVGGSTNIGSLSTGSIVTLSVGDTLEIWAITATAADRIVTFEDIQFNLIKIGA